MPKTTKKTKRSPTTLKNLPATAKEVSKKDRKRIGGKGGIAPLNTIGGAPRNTGTVPSPQLTLSSPGIPD